MDQSTEGYTKPALDNSSSGSTLYTETYSHKIKALFLCVGITALVSSTIAIIALRRTRRIPFAEKFLATGLLTFDLLYITFITVRKFVQNPLYNTSLQVLSTTVLQLSYVTVALMSLERCIMFSKPMEYMKMCTEKVVRATAFTTWTLTVTIFQSVRYGACYVVFESDLVFEEAGKCNQIVTIYYIALVMAVLTTSMVCYGNIFYIVKAQLTKCGTNSVSFTATANVLRTYKSTSLVLVYLLVILSTSVIYALIIVFIRYMNLGVGELRLSLEAISTVNCVLDPFLYVMWFKESQMEVCRLFARFSKRLQKKAEDMKYEVFDIVTSNTRSSRSDLI